MGPDIKQNKSLRRVKKPAGKINEEKQGVKERRIINSLPLTSKLINKYKRTREKTNTHLEKLLLPKQNQGTSEKNIGDQRRKNTATNTEKRTKFPHISRPQELHLQRSAQKEPNLPLKTEILAPQAEESQLYTWEKYK